MRRNPKKRWLVWVGVAVVVLVGAAAAAAPFLVPVDRYRPLLEQYLTTSTGRGVEIGSLRLSLWPRVHVHATDVRLLNPAGFPDGNAVEARTVDLGIAPQALLAGRLEIQTIAITNVQATLLIDAAGRTNYDVPAHPAAQPAAGAPPPIRLAPIDAASIKDVALAVRTVDRRRGKSTPVAALTRFNVTVGLFDPSAADWAKRLRITADLGGARIVTPFFTAPLALQSGTLALRGGAGTAMFAVTLGPIRASGRAMIARLHPPAVTFTVVVPTLDVAALQHLTGPQNGLVALAPPGPQPLIARGAFDIGRVTTARFQGAQVHSTVRIYGDRIRADAYRLSAYGGTVRGSALLEFAGRALPASATAVVRGVNLTTLLHAAAPRNPGSTGTIDADLSVSTAFGGGNPLAALTGHGTFVVRNGALLGVNIPGQAKSMPGRAPSSPMPFRSFGGDVRFAHERMYSNSLRLDAAAVMGSGHGSVGFDQTLDYVGVAVFPLGRLGAARSPAELLTRVLSDAAGATAESVPFLLRGTIDDPKFVQTGAPQYIRGGSSGRNQTMPPPGQPSFRPNPPQHNR